MNKILVFGASGQLGQCLKYVAEQTGFKGLIFPAEEIADILNNDAIEKLVIEEKPQYIINCAAYTAVDKAEDDSEKARLINAVGPANLARLCAKMDVVFIHVSTDFVFCGNEVKLLSEKDEAKPINVYGLTKLEGEQAITSKLNNYFILRTSWLYSEYGNNFVKTMQKLGKERDELKIISDQIGTPTYGIDLAACILEIIKSGSKEYGLYHYSNEGLTSWYDFAKAIFQLSNINVKAIPVSTLEYLTKAIRPPFSVMDKAKIKAQFGITIPYWRDSLEICIKRLKEINQ